MDNFEIKIQRKRVYDNKYLNNLVKENNFSDQDIDRNILTFLAYFSSQSRCKNCVGLENCPQTQKGKELILEVKGKEVIPYFTNCQLLKEEVAKEENYLTVLGYNFQEIESTNVYIDKETGDTKKESPRNKLLKRINKIIAGYQKGTPPTKGLFIYGSHGIGKTYLMAYLAKQLADLKNEVYFLFYPDLVRKVKSQISTGRLEELINELKTVDVLMLDDFGAETCTNFIRDEILGPVLQARMTEQLPVFMTSNLDLKDESLIDHLSETNQSSEKVKATRIYSRMVSVMDFYELAGDDYRKKDRNK